MIFTTLFPSQNFFVFEAFEPSFFRLFQPTRIFLKNKKTLGPHECVRRMSGFEEEDEDDGWGWDGVDGWGWEDEDEEREHLRNGSIEDATSDAQGCCNRLQTARVLAESAAVAVCMGQHVRLGGGSVNETCSPIYSLPALAMSHIVHVFMADCKTERQPILSELNEHLRLLVRLNEAETIDWGEVWQIPQYDSVTEALGFLSTALGIGLDESEDSDSIVSQKHLCSKVQSRACRLMYDVGRSHLHLYKYTYVHK
jgi:hypothetical protein